jgi:hypothetical protein
MVRKDREINRQLNVRIKRLVFGAGFCWRIRSKGCGMAFARKQACPMR